MRRLILPFLGFLFLAVPALAGPLDDPLDEDAVRGELIERLQATGAFTRIEALPDGTVDIDWAEGDGGNAYLGNLLRDMVDASPKDRDAQLQAYVQSMLLMARRDAQVPDHGTLRISVYDDAYIAEVHRLSTGAETPPTLAETMQPRRRIAGTLWQVIVIDTPSSTYVPTPDELQKMGLTTDQAWEVAHDNLLALAGQVQIEAYDNGFWLLLLDGYYENTLLTVPQVWEQMQTVIDGTPVAVSPARGFLLVGRAEDPASVETVRRIAKEVFETRGHPISTEMLIWRDGAWASY